MRDIIKYFYKISKFSAAFPLFKLYFHQEHSNSTARKASELLPMPLARGSQAFTRRNLYFTFCTGVFTRRLKKLLAELTGLLDEMAYSPAIPIQRWNLAESQGKRIRINGIAKPEEKTLFSPWTLLYYDKAPFNELL
ncbi:hypothetical protein V1498_08435 [Peribacillus sp. SCS-26]|uniref:hypothetical protein n=1 Tax=Paraperibacillus marinus TaxID=3115295 RepID=UPI0039058C44